MNLISNKKHLLIVAHALVVLSLGSCQSAPKPEVSSDAAVEKVVSFTLHEGTLVKNENPLPNYKGVLLDWTVDGETIHGKERYRLWDINKDGRFDMVERLSLTGLSLGFISDFNGDGRPDFIREKIVEK
jgi:hypothetical protein